MKRLLLEYANARTKVTEAEAERDRIALLLAEAALTSTESDAPSKPDSKPEPRSDAAPRKVRPNTPNHEAVARRYADFEPASEGCLCGCGEGTAEGSDFLRGHSKRLRSIVASVGAGCLDINKIPEHARDHVREADWAPDSVKSALSDDDEAA